MPFSAVAVLLVRTAEEEFDPDSVTPGPLGFIAIFVLMIAVILLALDMVRRIRRTNYRAEIRERLEAEQLAAEAEAAANAGEQGEATDAPGETPGDGPDEPRG
ncbi:hypothetical protein ARHIZOSPH14_25650 [Agromyces rhizosphaerae]|uniref:Uncharacterized protein n=1 Tax=Agromyces rhizosphaerae TaxID=88374 RepID=A0A9W6FSN1_9MICO|nr:hypothetical protein [Agromyces rhizosphaerae]GLI28323.1 hypothetical protein ARHIZOSPH14_25650 [Agromyces rhizosphaerae]